MNCVNLECHGHLHGKMVLVAETSENERKHEIFVILK